MGEGSKYKWGKRKMSSILSEVIFYDECVLLFQIDSYFYYLYTNDNFPSRIFVAYLILGERSLRIIGQYASSQRETRRKICGAG